MQFALTQVTSRRLDEKSLMIIAVSDALEAHFAQRDYGSAVDVFLIGVICIEPEFEPFHPVEPPKYLKKDKGFEYDLKLDLESFLNADMDQARWMLATAVLNSVRALRGRKIGDFDLPRFEEDLQSFLAERGWLLPGTDVGVESGSSPEDEDASLEDDGKYELPAPLPEDTFWSIIDKSRAVIAPDINTERQCESASEILLAVPEDQIVGFELALRDLLRKANHFNVMAACRICEDYVGDDNYLYFRAGLVSLGREAFYAAIENPDTCAEALILNTEGEYVLYIADNAFLNKFGDDTDKALPRDLAINYYNYDLDMEEPAGEDWTEEELPHRCPRLWQAAKNKRS